MFYARCRRYLTIFFLVCLLARPAAAASPFEGVAAQDLDGKPVTAEQFQKKITVAVVADRTTADAATQAGADLQFNLRGEPGFFYVVVLNLRDIPGIAHGLVLGLIKDKAKSAEQDLQKRFALAGKDLTARQQRPLFIPDWDGELALRLWQNSPLPEFAIFRKEKLQSRFERERTQREEQPLREHVHFFILGPDGEVKAHYLDAGAVGTVIDKVRALLKGPPPSPAVSSAK
ncbi:hypothetical protein [Gloeobacter kilaueensis]|uniref:Uncharacterized protein n=1 Tax=Gloeobacter kilaueensis (strain ATCC BAA-2537 / CCAP 1431/1 / ULC 316 / JS1) TaxID=1183438 RepID=U5QHM3_GLOK1|nr:hypothetical protein [Gloeobacter kilaueensis]AGY58421.1 hypothetical protein GKIL_2175 [Gloeobacter kilaueensis JS1]